MQTDGTQLRHLTELGRGHDIAAAQQESVALAQVIKAQQRDSIQSRKVADREREEAERKALGG